MLALKNCKFVPIIQAQAIKDDTLFVGSHGSTPINVDCASYAYALFVFCLGASDIAVAELSLYDSNTTTDGDFAIIAASNYATSPLTLPSATADNTAVAWHVDLRNRKRYMRMNAKPGDGTAGSFAYAFAILYRGDDNLQTAAGQNFAQIVSI